MSEHDGHRERLRNRFLKTGLDSFEPHEILELLLTYVIPRRDTNPLAHALLDHFGSLDKVLDASISDLMSVDGVGESTAIFITFIPQLFRQYEVSRQASISSHMPLTNSLRVGEFMKPYFIGETVETCYLICLNSDSTPIRVEQIATGVVSSVMPYFRNIIDKLLLSNASCAILCHNHPVGNASPSSDDISFSIGLDQLLASVDIPLLDHVIIGHKNYYSFADHYVVGPHRRDIDLNELSKVPTPFAPEKCF